MSLGLPRHQERVQFDCDAIRDNCPIEIEVARHVALKHDGREYTGLCPFHNERTPSFKIVPAGADKKGRGGFFHCFGCGADGDVITWTQRIYSVDFIEACKILDGGAHLSASPRSESRKPIVDPYANLVALPPPVAPIQAGTWLRLYNPKRATENPERATFRANPSAVYPYRCGDGALLGYVLRIDQDGGGKITPQVRWAKCQDGQERWACWQFPAPRPLYRAEEWAKKSGPILLVEGEKSADAARELLGELATTWPGGGKAVGHAAWSQLSGRDLYLWGDADQEGEYAMIGKPSIDGRPPAPGVAQLAAAAGAKIKAIFEWDRSKPKGWDAADALRDGWSRQQTIEWMNEQVRIWN